VSACELIQIKLNFRLGVSASPPTPDVSLRRSETTRMGWTGRAPTRNGFQSVWGVGGEKEHPMPRTTTIHAVTVIGIDMGKSTLHMVGLDSSGAIVLREKVSRGRIT
jgi:hypothetical protein